MVRKREPRKANISMKAQGYFFQRFGKGQQKGQHIRTLTSTAGNREGISPDTWNVAQTLSLQPP